MTLIADGDSSVYARIREDVSVWGEFVKKAECANHVCKCLRGNLEKLVDENPSYEGKGNLPKSTRIRQVSSVRWAIRMRSKPNGPRQANLVLIAYASSEGSGEPAHPRSLARTFAARSYKQ